MKSARRRVAVIGLSVLGLGGLFAGTAEAHASSVLPAGNWTPEQVKSAEELVHHTEATLPKYLTREELKAQGFVDFGVSTPDGWDHWTNVSRVDDNHVLDPAFPEALVMRKVPEGYRVDAAMFFLPSKYTMKNIPADLAWLPGWHTHENELCVNADGKFSGIPNPQGQCTSGKPLMSPPMMHVWRVDNRCGHRFATLGAFGLGCLGDDMDHGGHGTVPPMPVPVPPPAPTVTPTVTPTVSPPPTQTAVSPATAVRANPSFTG